MAKRKRLTPAPAGAIPPAPTASSARAPISQVAGDASISAAFETVRDELQSAQREGRMLMALPLDAVRADYLIRDRLTCNAEEMTALQQSIHDRGQQTPIEVTDLGDGTYGLISGWRRLEALKTLRDESGGLARFATVQALLRLPKDRAAAYVAMLEENELRADLSYYERARIVVQAVGAGIFDSDKKALQSLFSTASFSKRSKIKSFMPLVCAFDGLLQHPALLPERLGLTLSKAIGDDPQLKNTLAKALRAAPDATPEEERAILERRGARRPASRPETGPDAQVGDVSLQFKRGRIVLEGKGVDAALRADLEAWLTAR